MEAVAKTPHLLTVQEYMTLVIPGRTELLEGLVYDVSPKNERHSLAVSRLTRALDRGLNDRYRVRCQDPLAVGGWTGKYAPEIDVAVVAERAYRTTPTASDAFAFIEVSETTYDEDRRDNIPLYVRAAVPTWHVNIRARRVEFYAVGADINQPLILDEHEAIDVLGITIAIATLFEQFDAEASPEHGN